jgi:hypothetical protein
MFMKRTPATAVFPETWLFSQWRQLNPTDASAEFLSGGYKKNE